MDFENIIETINFELVLEGLGTIFGVGLLWKLFFQQGLLPFLSLFLSTIC